ncbi:hypothetical protein GCM10010168_53090 [Actinoplanes ianthinogenes]|uniref:Uncharacterized protein n=1 Tax=Actinoplanes ianthinogenes TaxID=122358 RepID=A0ABM7LR16_9ACTN|nr:hypothetical protein [Actinoplanes ianthinogenes]BCJ41693.1 hypothetical protein Aiant_23500 [Actinoplanes ianthinogenes]GGR28368.1 hypothetical protein GCM10010168_53090 [Actinoplanes ianthinogenes]
MILNLLAKQGHDRELTRIGELADLTAADYVVITGEASSTDRSRWAAAVGDAVIRGVRIERA